MKQIIVVDARDDFLSDLNIRQMLEPSEKINIPVILNSLENIGAVLGRSRPELLVICENAIPEGELDPVIREYATVGYGVSASGEALFKSLGLPYLTYRDIDDFITKLESFERKPIPAKTRDTSKVDSTTEPVRTQPQSSPEPVQEEAWEKELDESGLLFAGSKKDTPAADILVILKPSAPPIQDAKRHISEAEVKKAESALEQRLRHDTPGTKTVTVYSAKGGVGKTTLASELAVYLSLTSNGREKYKVCLVDYNIDFGDVLTTLELDQRGPNMSGWAAEIRERISAGESSGNIRFATEEVLEHLQIMEKTGLRVLTAPLTHEDSMDVGETELSVMLSSIRESGRFDFVVCDTGNNTRDSAILALEAADTVLLVATQDITTANCNDAFLSTMKRIGFDVGKIRLVVNDVLPEKDTGISVREVEETFPYPCVARIRHHADVIKANNFGTPLVYKTNHEYTKELQKVVAYLTGREETKEKKPGLFGFRKGDRK